VRPAVSLPWISDKRIAVVHEWIDAYAGSEQVFEALARIFPSADLYALSREPAIDLEVGGRPVRTTFLDHPFLRRHRSLTLPLMPAAWRILGRDRYDITISSHHAFAHANRLAASGAQLCYVHSPARYLWSPDIDQRGADWYLRPGAAILRRYDMAASRRITAYAANSSAVALRIEQFWGREATVIHPPVRVEYFNAAAATLPTRSYVLGVGRWIPYKNLHLVIEAADLIGMPVKIAGRGPDKQRIVAAAQAAKVPVQLIEAPSDAELRQLYRDAACLVFPTVEDFGIVPVEAQAAGTPVVATAQGGALDTIRDGKTGYLVREPTAVELSKRIADVGSIDPTECQRNAARFTYAEFAQAIERWITRSVG
jgi:glycosyltransferase involved in cell wall biosynthesis